MRLVIAGFGSAGRRFRDIVRKVGPAWDIGVYDPLASVEGVEKVYRDWKAALRDAGAAIVASPTSLHATQTYDALEARVPVLVEKPAAIRSVDIRRLVALQEKTKTPAFVGYNLRFDTPLRCLMAWARANAYHGHLFFGYNLERWRPERTIREGYAPFKKSGGGILLDASHELDIAISTFGRPKEVSAFLGSFRKDFGFGDTESSADVQLRYTDGRTIQIHLDYLASCYQRHARFYSKTERADDAVKHWQLLAPELARETYEAETTAFLASAMGAPSLKPLATLQESADVIDVINAARASMKSGRVQSLGLYGERRTGAAGKED